MYIFIYHTIPPLAFDIRNYNAPTASAKPASHPSCGTTYEAWYEPPPPPAPSPSFEPCRSGLHRGGDGGEEGGGRPLFMGGRGSGPSKDGVGRWAVVGW